MSLATFEMSMEDVRQAEPSSHAGPRHAAAGVYTVAGRVAPPLRILIVEDDQFTRQALEDAELDGAVAAAVRAARDAVGDPRRVVRRDGVADAHRHADRHRVHRPRLPGITGFDLSWFYLSKDAAPGASRPHDTAMIACSSADVTPEKLHEAGMHDFLKKPVTMPALRHIIHKWLPTPSDLPQVQLPPSPSRTNRGAFAARVLHVEDCEITKTATCGMLEQMDCGSTPRRRARRRSSCSRRAGSTTWCSSTSICRVA